MDVERAEGIVLRCVPVTESSLVVTWFTREFGKLKTLAKGARRVKGSMRGRLDLFYRDEILFLRSRRSDLHLLSECFLEEAHPGLRERMERVVMASYVCELVESVVGMEDANSKVFELLGRMLRALEGEERVELVFWFELQLLAALGWAPRWGEPEGVGRVLKALGGVEMTAAGRVRLSGEQVVEVRGVLDRLWATHVERLPKSRLWGRGKCK